MLILFLCYHLHMWPKISKPVNFLSKVTLPIINIKTLDISSKQDQDTWKLRQSQLRFKIHFSQWKNNSEAINFLNWALHLSRSKRRFICVCNISTRKTLFIHHLFSKFALCFSSASSFFFAREPSIKVMMIVILFSFSLLLLFSAKKLKHLYGETHNS